MTKDDIKDIIFDYTFNEVQVSVTIWTLIAKVKGVHLTSDIITDTDEWSRMHDLIPELVQGCVKELVKDDILMFEEGGLIINLARLL